MISVSGSFQYSFTSSTPLVHASLPRRSILYKAKLAIVLLLTAPLLSFSFFPAHKIYFPAVVQDDQRSIVCQGEITAVVYVDDNANGRLDLQEKGMAAVQVTLYVSSKLQTTRFTNDQGYHRLDIPPGRYELRAMAPAGYEWTTPNAWGIDVECAPIQIIFGLQARE